MVNLVAGIFRQNFTNSLEFLGQSLGRTTILSNTWDKSVASTQVWKCGELTIPIKTQQFLKFFFTRNPNYPIESSLMWLTFIGRSKSINSLACASVVGKSSSANLDVKSVLWLTASFWIEVLLVFSEVPPRRWVTWHPCRLVTASSRTDQGALGARH